MKLVLIYTQSDGCTYWAENTLPINYESVEKAEYDLFESWENYTKGGRSDINFAGHEIGLDYLTEREYDAKSKKTKFHYQQPEILTLDEWFDKYAPN